MQPLIDRFADVLVGVDRSPNGVDNRQGVLL